VHHPCLKLTMWMWATCDSWGEFERDVEIGAALLPSLLSGPMFPSLPSRLLSAENERKRGLNPLSVHGKETASLIYWLLEKKSQDMYRTSRLTLNPARMKLIVYSLIQSRFQCHCLSLLAVALLSWRFFLKENCLWIRLKVEEETLWNTWKAILVKGTLVRVSMLLVRYFPQGPCNNYTKEKLLTLKWNNRTKDK